MESFDERVKHISLKILWAEKHLQKLEQELALFFEQNPFKVSVRIDEEDRKPIYYVASIDPVPDTISLIAGDIIQNLVTALDHLAYQLVRKDTNDAPPKPNAIYFPIASDLDRYEESKMRRLQGASQATIKAIDQVKPYKGGNDLIWSLHALNNIEKHRVLLTVGIKTAGMEVYHMIQDSIQKTFPQEAIDAIRSMGLFIKETEKGFPLAEGYELYIGAANEKPKADMRFRFDVGLNEAGILDEQSLLKVLREFKAEVDKVICELIPLLK